MPENTFELPWSTGGLMMRSLLGLGWEILGVCRVEGEERPTVRRAMPLYALHARKPHHSRGLSPTAGLTLVASPDR